MRKFIEIVFVDDIPQAESDGKTVKINETWFKSKDDNLQILILCHEIAHCVRRAKGGVR